MPGRRVTDTLRRLTAGAAILAALGGCTTDRIAAATPPLPPGATTVYVAGDIADCGTQAPERAAAMRTAALVPEGAVVLAPGDLAYPVADTERLQGCFQATWGRQRAAMLVAAGNHDYVQGRSDAVRAYFPQARQAASDEFLAYAVQPAPGWWLVVLDSNVVGERMRRQQAWFEQALQRLRTGPDAAASCLAVMWHTPLYSSGWHKGSGEHMRPAWSLADRYAADIVLSGHEHFYERFGPIDAAGHARRDGNAPRQFVVGTGGAPLYGFWKPPYRSDARVLRHGVLRLSLAPGRYAWAFIDTDGRTRDAGSATCRAARNSGNVPDTTAAPTDRR